MKVELAPEASRLVADLMKSGGYADAESTIVAGLMVLKQRQQGLADFLESLDDGKRARVSAMIEDGLAELTAGRVVDGKLAMKRARDLIDRKSRVSG